jgi:uncharacterized protein (TIGR02147 family)
MNSVGNQPDPITYPNQTNTSPTDVFAYEDYRLFLRDRFAEMQMLHPGFSQRGLARKAAIANPGFFNEVIKGRRRLSPAAAAKMAMGLDLAPEQAELFYALVEYTETREPRIKMASSRRLTQLRNRKFMQDLAKMSMPQEHFQEIARELGQEWDVNSGDAEATALQDGEGRPDPTPISEETRQRILERVREIRADSTSGNEPKE